MTLHQPLHSKVSNYLNHQRRSGQFCDMSLEIENGATITRINGHFCVIGAQSSLIGGPQFLQQHFSIQTPLRVRIQNFNCITCLQTIVDFCYDDVISVAKDHQSHFRTLVKVLLMTELLALYDMNPELDSTDSDCKDVIVVPATRESDQNADLYNEQRNYFKITPASRPVNASNKIIYCISCDFTTYRATDMIDHMSGCEASHLTCSLCEIGFLSWREYDVHLRKHSADMKKPYFCLECDARFMTRTALIVHQPKHTTETPHRCVHCGKGFKWKNGLASHLLTHSKEKLILCDVCGYSTTHMKALKSHKLNHTEEYFRCTFPGCKHTANRKENLKMHIETHRNKEERPFVCEICGCKFSQNKNLKRHALKHSTSNLNRHQCHLCPFGSHRSDKLKEHLQRLHTEKAVQLELPEVVENSFENRLEDGFNLPILGMAKDNASRISTESHNKKKNKTATKVERRKPTLAGVSNIRKKERPILPNTLINYN